MSYVEMMANHRWSEADHVRRTEAILRSTWSAAEEAILNRDFAGALSQMAPMTPELQARAVAFKAAAEAARLAGVSGRADAEMLHAALDYEEAQRELDALPPPPDPDENGNPVADPHAERRAELLQLLGAASEAVLALVLERAQWRAAQNPPAEPEPAEEPQP